MHVLAGSPRDLDAMLAYFLTKNSIEWRGAFSQGKRRGEAKLLVPVVYANTLGSSTAGKRKPSSQEPDFDATESRDEEEVTLMSHPCTFSDTPLAGIGCC